MNFRRVIYIISFLCVSFWSHAQQKPIAFQNFGNVKIHDQAEVGIHTNLINEGILDNKNLGFVGFYHNTEQLFVKGVRPEFYNVEVAVPNGLLLQTSMGVTNEFTFLEGDVITDKSNPLISLEFKGYQFHVGEDHDHYVDGYNSVISYNNEFIFPIGDDDRLRPMILPSQTNNFKGAYFFENPNTPTTFGGVFDTDTKVSVLRSVSKQEFWDLDGVNSTIITLTWDGQSNISALADKLEDLTVVGWSKTTKKWENLGGVAAEGDLSKGKITSLEFIPNDYEVITIGSVENIDNDICGVTNYTFTPDGDKINDTFVVDCADKYPKNARISIFNRWGNLVYRPKTISTPWEGISEGRLTVAKDKKLPTGVYFYVINYKNGKERKIRKGWVYLIR